MSKVELQPGRLAQALCGRVLPLEVCKSYAGFYLGTREPNGEPFTRESIEYWPDRPAAETALRTGAWTQKPSL